MSDLFSSYQLADIELKNRMVMAPMTRNRATEDGVATAIMAEHYSQRASAGLIISESTPVSVQGLGYPNTPNMFTAEQSAGWLRVVNAVHSKGGRIFAQLQHCGRVSHPSHQVDGALPVAPSAIRPAGQSYTKVGFQDFVTPRALETDEIAGVVNQFKTAAEYALAAGFDGIEVHGANGYLIDQFLRDGSNQRDDGYGGSLENRMRFLLEVLAAVEEVFPAGRVGLRLTPENSFHGMSDSAPQAHFEHVAETLSGRGLAYLHILEGDMLSDARNIDYRKIRDRFEGTYIANNGYDQDRAQQAIAGGDADLVAFGTPFLANPDLVRRYRENLPLNKIDQTTYFGGDGVGYTDYPFAGEGLRPAA
ncbi:alkene reductase [Oricola sp.]|uniref:alkene reductase n=1 Tax=Oricola sp. TaxID=1979950 RepID=UPI003BAB3D2D